MDELKRLYHDMDELESTLSVVTELGHLTSAQVIALNAKVRQLITMLNEYSATESE